MSRISAWIRRNSPSREQLLESRFLKPFAHRIAHSELWRFTRRSVPRGVALGLFVGIFLLIPGVQMIGVAMLALPVRANIPIGAAMTFLSNPATTPFIMAASIWIGNATFGLRADPTTWSRLWNEGASLGQWASWFFSDAAPALLAGLFIISAGSALVGYVLGSVVWNNWLRWRWRLRLRTRLAARHARVATSQPD
jgi:uncharacterized protein